MSVRVEVVASNIESAGAPVFVIAPGMLQNRLCPVPQSIERFVYLRTYQRNSGETARHSPWMRCRVIQFELTFLTSVLHITNERFGRVLSCNRSERNDNRSVEVVELLTHLTGGDFVRLADQWPLLLLDRVGHNGFAPRIP